MRPAALHRPWPGAALLLTAVVAVAIFAAPTRAQDVDSGLEAILELFGEAERAAQAGEVAAALARFEEASDAGLGAASVALGLLYELGLEGFPRDLEAAVGYYRKALDQGRDFVAARLGYLHLYGIGVARDKQAAKHLFRRAVFSLAREPKQILTIVFEQTLLMHRPFPYEFQQAVEWSRNVTTWDGRRQYGLSLEYRHGEGAEKDGRLADYLLAEAAESGYPQAQYEAAALLLESAPPPGRARLILAARYLHEAASAGHGPSQALLAARYAASEMPGPDPMKALYWLLRARAGGTDVAARMRASAAAASPEERYTALRRLALDEPPAL